MYQIDYMSVEMCSQKPSQREYHYRRLYNHAIEFKKDIMLSKPIKGLSAFFSRKKHSRQID